ncbi:YfiM family protein [Ralstonia solanacearum]|uniref:YfiM family protein n=1 Tax=Ralstonia solanacearum TaxID=305 RepID=UPI0006DBE869|nr:YfiM family protein [Ralstonia solanacearum]
MFRSYLAALFTFFLMLPCAQADVRHDKYLHAGVSAIIASSVTALAVDSPNRLWYGLGTSLAVGVAKEMADRRKTNGKFDSKDLLADLVGALIGAYATDSLLRPAIIRQPTGYAFGVQLHVAFD